MDRRRQLDHLLETGVLAEVHEDEFGLSAPFLDEVTGHRDGLSTADDLEAGLTHVLDDDEAAWVAETSRGDTELAARHATLRSRLADRSREELLSLALLLAQLERGPPRDAGAPAAFVPVYGDQLPVLVELYRRCIVYIWRHDCDPCDLVREDFAELFETHPEDIACFAVYGPESSALLQEEFDVVGGPTTLFVIDGRVDARVQGAAHRETYVEEIRTLRERTGAPAGAGE